MIEFTDDGWRMPDWLWERLAPLLRERPAHPLGCHNPRVPDRDAMDAILVVLRTGMQWNALNATSPTPPGSAAAPAAAAVHLELGPVARRDDYQTIVGTRA